MPFYADLSRYQTIANNLKQSKIDIKFLKLYDEIYTSVCSDKCSDVKHEYNRLDILIYLLIEAYPEYLPPEYVHFADGYQDYFAHLLDTTIIQNDVKTTYRQMLLDTAVLLQLNHFIKTSGQFSPNFLNTQYPDAKAGWSNYHQLMLTAVAHNNHALLKDKALFSDAFLNAQCPGKNQGWTNRHQLIVQAVGHNNHALLKDKALFPDAFLNAQCPGKNEGWVNTHILMLEVVIHHNHALLKEKDIFVGDFLNAPWPGNEEGLTSRDQLLLEAVKHKNNTIFTNEDFFSDDYLNAQCPGAEAGWSNRHQLMLAAVVYDNHNLLNDKNIFPGDFLNAQCPGADADAGWSNRHQLMLEAVAANNNAFLNDKDFLSDDFLNEQCPDAKDGWSNRHRMIEDALYNKNHEILKDSLIFGKTREDASKFLQTFNADTQVKLYKIRQEALEQKIDKTPATEDIMESTLRRAKVILDKLYPKKSEQLDPIIQKLLTKIGQKLKSYKTESAISFEDLVNKDALYVKGENPNSYSSYELKESLKSTKGLSPFTKLTITEDDIDYGFASGDLEELVKQCITEYEESLNKNKRTISSPDNFFPSPKKRKDNEDGADDVKKNTPSNEVKKL